ncbi:DUF5682 family protein [Microbulbifer sp. PSTR4-B]|uniref:DUF5682 family protein n=1 Tax=Microbulbifer sp. PSTR4-B TaxID=3243396 RepID=UPI0040391E11
MVDAPLISRTEVDNALFGTREGRCLFAPIRHHSPVCAWMLRAMLDDFRPEEILIEVPSDLECHLPDLTASDIIPPVAIVTLGAQSGQSSRAVRYFPFSEHSPEFVAITHAKQIGAVVRFIDLPAGTRVESVEKASTFHSEVAFDSAAFIQSTCNKLGLRDGAELWDHLFEVHLGQSDWRTFFADVYAYCLAIRETTAPEVIASDDTLQREAHMRAYIAQAEDKRIVVLTGGFHTPALIEKGCEAPFKASALESYLIGYGEEALDALSGYAAGLRYPGWYAGLWQAACAADGPPDWSAHALEVGTGFAALMAEEKRRVAIPQLVEMLSMAEGLAHLKGRKAVLIPDLFDGMRSALVKTEIGPGEPFSECLHRYLRGNNLGQASQSAGLPPIVADARARADSARVNMSDTVKRNKKLDIRRKTTHRKASQFFHQMGLLSTGFAEFKTGPNFVTGERTDLLFEEWAVGWSPFVEGALIEAARLGSTLPEAAVNQLAERRTALFDNGSGNDLVAQLELLLLGLRAGLGSNLIGLAAELHDAVTISANFDGLAQVLFKLQAVSTPGDPLFDEELPDLSALLAAAYEKIIYLMDDLSQTPEDMLVTRIKALETIASVVQGPHAKRFNSDRFSNALARLLEQQDCAAILIGAVAGLLVRANLRSPEYLAKLLQGTLLGIGSTPEGRAAVLQGILMTAPMLLWQNQQVLKAVNTAIMTLDEDTFVTILPALRRCLTQLNPHETDRLAEELTTLLGVQGGNIAGAKSHFSEEETTQALAIDRAMGALLEADGLTHWKLS